MNVQEEVAEIQANFYCDTLEIKEEENGLWCIPVVASYFPGNLQVSVKYKNKTTKVIDLPIIRLYF
jgi:hypothetical protein